MSKTLRVSNLAPSTSPERLQEICAEFGTVARVGLVASPYSGVSRGFGYVEMKTEAEAASCRAGLNDTERDGNKLNVVDAPAALAKKHIGKKS